MAELPATIMEHREELMIPPSGEGEPFSRTAHFIKPTATITPAGGKPIFNDFLSPSTTQNWPLEVSFHGWKNIPEKWKTWIGRMRSIHRSTWVKSGIYEAVLNSTIEIQRNSSLLFGVAEKWSSETNTFIFPSAEATITLEDMLVLGGYSILGDSVLSSFETAEMKEVEEKLMEARSQIIKTASKKASHGLWLAYFMNDKNKIQRQCEHEAFLSLWLSRFVFPSTKDSVAKHTFPIAIRLARGDRIALAPAVLACIYKELRLLKESITALTSTYSKYDKNRPLKLTLWAPFQLVQVWIWERFKSLNITPSSTKSDEPRFARWHKVRVWESDIAKLGLHLDASSFRWRPYGFLSENCLFHKLYREKEYWVLVDHKLGIEFESFARCMRVCELVGFDCIEQYLPHRVALQFGMDQDLPGFVARNNESPNIAWRTYNRPITDVKLYIPPNSVEANVTLQYFKWSRRSMPDQDDYVNVYMRRRKCSKKSRGPYLHLREKEGDESGVPPGFWSKKREERDSSDEEDEVSILEKPNSKRTKLSLEGKNGDASTPSTFLSKPARMRLRDSDEEDNLTIAEALSPRKLELSEGKKGRNVATAPRNFDRQCVEKKDATIPPGFTPKCYSVESVDPSEEDNLTIAKLFSSRKQGEGDDTASPVRDRGESFKKDRRSQYSSSSSGEGKCDKEIDFQKSRGKLSHNEVLESPRIKEMDMKSQVNNTASRSFHKGQNKLWDIDVLCQELEDRISRVEKIFAAKKTGTGLE